MNSSLVRFTPSSSGRLSPPAALSLGLFASASQAATIVLIDATTRNGSFDSYTGTALVSGKDAPSKIATGYDVSGHDVNFWQNAGATYADTGIQFNTTSGWGQDAGSIFAYQKNTDDGAFNLTSYTIQTGDVFTLTWYAKRTGNSGTQDVRLFASSDLTFATGVTLAQNTASLNGGANTSAYTQYTLTYTSIGADAGKSIGVFFDNTTTGGNFWASFDNFVLTVEPSAVPEPSTYAALGGVGALAFAAMRRRRKSVQA